jgi:hypothetical protein
MCKGPKIELEILNFVINAPAGSRFCYGESEAKPSWFAEQFIDRLYKHGYVYKERQNCAAGSTHYYIVRTLKPLSLLI